MSDFADFYADNDRVQIYRPGTTVEDGRCVLYWMQRAQRGQDNHALNAAIELGNSLDIPVVVLFVLTVYPSANLRHYTFLLEGLQNVAKHLHQRGTPLIIRQGVPPEEVVHVAKELKAAAVISDGDELRVPRSWREEVKKHLAIPFACVDADVVVPSKYFTKEEWGAYTLRNKLQKLLPTYLQPIENIKVKHALRKAPIDAGDVESPLNYLKHLKIDKSVEPSADFHGGEDEGKRRIESFMKERLASYTERRNLPEVKGTSEISAYLHFGHISVQQLAWEIESYVPKETGSAKIDISGGRSAYLEELIVRRELSVNFALHNDHYDSIEGCPDWGKKALKKHENDPREWVYTRKELEEATTHDELWNACQREMTTTGRMHGYMRMYWAKKILEWTESPEAAFEDAVYLNDKYELDGRDANGYTGISWAIGGRHDRPWPPDRAIFGTVRYMALSGMKRKMDTKAYIYQWRKQ